MNYIKSVAPVQAYGNGHSGNWLAHVILQSGEELFAGLNNHYDICQAQTLIETRKIWSGGVFDTDTVPAFTKLPKGTRIKSY